MNRPTAIALITLAVIACALGALTILRSGTSPPRTSSHARASKDATADNSLTKAEENKVVLGNIATLPFQELFDFLAKKSADEIAGLARQLAALPPGAVTNARLKLFFKAWAGLDAKSAFAAAADFADRAAKNNAIEAIVEGVAPNEAGEVMRALMELPEGELYARPSLLSRGIVKWSEADPAAAAEFLRTTGGPAIKADGQGGLGFAGLTWGSVAQNFGATDPTAALAWVATITDSQQASSALQGAIVGWSQKEPQAAMDYVAAHADQLAFQQTAGTLASNLAQHDPDEATRWLDQLPPAARLQAVTGIAGTLAFNDPQAAIHWAESLSPNEQDSAASMIVSRGAQKDPQAVADWIATLKGDTRDNALATYSSAVAAKDPATALSWAETVSNPETRDRASWEVASRWLQSDPAAARTWIRKSAFPDDEKKRLLGPLPAP
jgi:hypothetical protein